MHGSQTGNGELAQALQRSRDMRSCRNVAQTLLQREFTDRERATMGSLAALLGSVLYALVALGAGLVADRWGIVPALLTIQAVALVALPLAWSVHRTHRTKQSQPDIA